VDRDIGDAPGRQCGAYAAEFQALEGCLVETRDHVLVFGSRGARSDECKQEENV
jgi:hypothetical protein